MMSRTDFWRIGSGLAAAVVVALFFCSSARAQRSLGDLSGPWQLLVDDWLVAEKAGVERTWHPFEKCAANPVMTADRPWEGSTAYLYGTVLPAEKGPGYRMWYHSWADNEYRKLYATSTDGLTWEKPELGLVDYRGSTKNNMFLRRSHEDHSPQIIHTPADPDPERRYKLITYEYGRTPPKYTISGYLGAYSPDGIHWTEAPKYPILSDPGDVGNFVWDPFNGRYLGYPKKFTEIRGFRRRCVGFSETSVFESWPAARLVLVPDEFDDRWVETATQHTDFYGLSAFAYESMYLGFLWVFRITDGTNDGPIFVEMVTSRDGVNWTRQEEPRTPVLPTGPKGAWDRGMVFTPNHPLVENDRIRLYYGGFDVTHGADGTGRSWSGHAPQGRVCLARCRSKRRHGDHPTTGWRSGTARHQLSGHGRLDPSRDPRRERQAVARLLARGVRSADGRQRGPESDLERIEPSAGWTTSYATAVRSSERVALFFRRGRQAPGSPA